MDEIASATVRAFATCKVLAHDGLVPGCKRRGAVGGGNLASKKHGKHVGSEALTGGALGRAAASLELVVTVRELAVLSICAEAAFPPRAQLGLVRHRCTRCRRGVRWGAAEEESVLQAGSKWLTIPCALLADWSQLRVCRG